jgi:N-acetylated-alpha-linked acidic dipeptidase
MSAIDAQAREIVSKDALYQSVDYLCSLGEKVSGSLEEEKACAYIVGKLKEYGYEPTVHEFDSYLSYPRSATLKVGEGANAHEFPCVGVAFGLSTPKEGFTADVVFVGTGTEAEYEGKDVRGKIALVSKLPSPNNALAAVAAGAKGMICMSAGKQRHKMIITPVWGTPEFDQATKIPRLHVVSVAKPDGEHILADLEKGNVRATLVTDCFEGWRKVRLPVAEIKGEEPLFSLVGAHYCSWFDGSTDNVTGNSCVLELARVLKQFEGRLRYGLKFAWWPGHSHGRYSGSTWFADTFWHDLHENAIVYFNIDSPGVKGATVYVPRHQMAEVSEFNERMTEEITGWTTLKSSNAQLAIGKRGDKYVSSTRPGRAADQSFWGVGLSSMSVYSMLTPDDPNRDPNVGGSGGAWWWHSEHETIDKMDTEVLAQDTRLYASILLRLATADVLPFDLTVTAQDYLDSLREYDETSGDILPFRDLIAEVGALQAKFAGLHERCHGLTDRKKSGAANKLFLGIARVLNPILYQACSPFAHDPALGSRALPGLGAAIGLKAIDPTSDAFKFTVVGLKRRMNQVRHQVREASRLVDQEIATLS